MIQRVNFIEKTPYAISYRNMLIFAGIVCVICLLANGLFVLRNTYLKSKIASTNKEIQVLTIQKEKTLAAMQIAQTKNVGSVTSLASLFVKMPAWSSVLSEMSKRMPKQVWFDNIRSSNIGDLSDRRKLEMSGKSVSHASIAQLVNSLEESEYFQNTVLVKSQRGADGYSFIINSETLFPKAEW